MTKKGTSARHKLLTAHTAKSGLPPGTLVHIGEQSDREIRITVLDYDEGNCDEKVITTLNESFYFVDKGKTITWIDVEGLHDVEIIQKFGDYQGVHPLVLEDIVNTDQRPKLEDYGDYLYIVLKMLHPGEHGFTTEQVSLILGANFLISFQEGIHGDDFAPIKERIKSGKGKIRGMGADYLAYSLIDPIVDNYFTILEKIGERIEELEEQAISNPSPQVMRSMQSLKRELIQLRRATWPLREVVSAMERRDSPLISDQVSVYLRDVYDHTVRVIETLEAYRDMLAGMLDIYLSSLSNRLNEVMKFLTIIGTIFIPLTFIAGVYGMNFQHMPELHWKYGYFAALGLMLAVALGLLGYFKRKKWL